MPKNILVNTSAAVWANKRTQRICMQECRFMSDNLSFYFKFKTPEGKCLDNSWSHVSSLKVMFISCPCYLSTIYSFKNALSVTKSRRLTTMFWNWWGIWQAHCSFSHIHDFSYHHFIFKWFLLSISYLLNRISHPSF